MPSSSRPFFPNRFAEHRHTCPTCTAAAHAPTVAEEVQQYCTEGRRLTAPVDTSHMRTWLGPRPPSRPADNRTFIWSTCTRCGWYTCFLEDQQAMEHTMTVTEHAREACATDGQLSLLIDEP